MRIDIQNDPNWETYSVDAWVETFGDDIYVATEDDLGPAWTVYEARQLIDALERAVAFIEGE